MHRTRASEPLQLSGNESWGTPFCTVHTKLYSLWELPHSQPKDPEGLILPWSRYTGRPNQSEPRVTANLVRATGSTTWACDPRCAQTVPECFFVCFGLHFPKITRKAAFSFCGMVKPTGWKGGKLWAPPLPSRLLCWLVC